MVLDDLLALDPDDWADGSLTEVARTDLPTGGPTGRWAGPCERMVDADIDHLPVIDAAGASGAWSPATP